MPTKKKRVVSKKKVVTKKKTAPAQSFTWINRGSSQVLYTAPALLDAVKAERHRLVAILDAEISVRRVMALGTGDFRDELSLMDLKAVRSRFADALNLG